jgi:hypothetical protein
MVSFRFLEVLYQIFRGLFTTIVIQLSSESILYENSLNEPVNR